MAHALTITLTKTEAEAVGWAFGAMSDYWGGQCEPDTVPDADAEGVFENDLAIPKGAAMPFLTGNVLTLSTWDEINDDLRYRVSEQLPDMVDDAKCIDGDMSPQRAGQMLVMCERLTDKLRAAGVE